MRIRRPLLWLLGILIIVALVIFWGWDEVASSLRNIHPLTLVGLAALQTFTLGLTAYQWHFLLKKLRATLPFAQVFGIHLASQFVESITPSVKLGGEAAKIYLLRVATGLSHQALVGAMLTHKYLSLLPFVLLCGVVLVSVGRHVAMPAYSFAAFIALFVVFAGLTLLLRPRKPKSNDHARPHAQTSPLPLALPQKIGWYLRRIQRFLEDALGYARVLTNARERSGLLTISLIIWVLYPVKVMIVTGMLGYPVGIQTVAFATYTAYLVSMVPLSPGGLGSFEGVMALLLTLEGLTLPQGLAIALTTRLITFWFPLVLSAGATGLMIGRTPSKEADAPLTSSYRFEAPSDAKAPSSNSNGTEDR